MDVSKASLDAIYAGWLNYQSLLIDALARLKSDQLALQAAPNLRSIEAIATHMIGARGRWFAPPLGDGDKHLTAVVGLFAHLRKLCRVCVIHWITSTPLSIIGLPPIGKRLFPARIQMSLRSSPDHG